LEISETITRLKQTLGEGGVLTGDEVSGRGTGWLSRRNMQAAAIVRPRNTGEVSEVLRVCHHAGQPLVPHGGLTGLVEGTHTGSEEIALSLELMDAIEDLDADGATMTVQAGAILRKIHERAESAGLLFPLDLGARGSATIGGLISTNAGGNRVIRYGMTRNLVLGLEAVLADGTVVSSMYPIVKNNSGYDLKQLFIGSEGTLGIVTRAILRLTAQPRSQNTALLGVNEFSHLPALLRELSGGLGGTLSAFEVMWSEFYRLVSTPPAKQHPILSQTFRYYVIADALGSDQVRDQERFEEVLTRAVDKGLAEDCVVALSAAERAAIWALRDDVDQFHQYRPWFGFDVSMPIRHMESYVNGVRAQLDAAWPENRTFVFGHMGDGNLHLNIHVGRGEEASRRRVEGIVYGALGERQGSVSAEHGIGLEKRSYLKLCRTQEEIGLMRTLKRALDPKGILNPGKVLEVMEAE
jgi:FAD/FMN-containing dehydrogenase